MKRFLAFAGSNYYPCGGWNDLVGDFDTPEEANEAATGAADPDFGWWNVADTETGQVCGRGRRTGGA